VRALGARRRLPPRGLGLAEPVQVVVIEVSHAASGFWHTAGRLTARAASGSIPVYIGTTVTTHARRRAHPDRCPPGKIAAQGAERPGGILRPHAGRPARGHRAARL